MEPEPSTWLKPVAPTTAYVSFQTSLGACSIAWSELGLTCVRLPDETGRPVPVQVGEVAGLPDGSDPPAEVLSAIEGITRLLEGEAPRLGHLRLDMRGVPPYHRRVFEAVRLVGPGQTTTYGVIARQLGDATAVRAVGQALRRNPFVLVVPCHRVLGADGRLGGFTAPGGVSTKVRLLRLEGVTIAESPRFPELDLA